MLAGTVQICDNEDGLSAVDRNVKVEWVNCDEGFCGDYNPNDPNDLNLLRFEVSINRAGTWIAVEDASYCTLMPADTPKPILMRALQFLLREYSNVLDADPEQSVKKLGENLSWISPEWFEE